MCPMPCQVCHNVPSVLHCSMCPTLCHVSCAMACVPCQVSQAMTCVLRVNVLCHAMCPVPKLCVLCHVSHDVPCAPCRVPCAVPCAPSHLPSPSRFSSTLCPLHAYLRAPGSWTELGKQAGGRKSPWHRARGWARMPHVPSLPSATRAPKVATIPHLQLPVLLSSPTPVSTATFQLINFHPEALEGPEELGGDFSSQFSSLSFCEKNHAPASVPPH